MYREVLTILGLGFVALLAMSAPQYDRDAWKHWTDADGDCQDTRQEVLLEEAEQVALDGDCKVIVGKWRDPYSGETLYDPAYIDIDHMIPLKEAWRSGGWNWSAAKRERFANDLDHTDHLVATHRTWNRSKRDKPPQLWMPPDESTWCWYSGAWLDEKRLHGLRMTVEEAEFVFGLLDGCD